MAERTLTKITIIRSARSTWTESDIRRAVVIGRNSSAKGMIHFDNVGDMFDVSEFEFRDLADIRQSCYDQRPSSY